MISSVNNLLPIKTFRVETEAWTQEFNDHSVFNCVRGLSSQWERMSAFVESAQVNDWIVIGHKKVTCLRVNTQAILLNIEAKKVEIENLEAML